MPQVSAISPAISWRWAPAILLPACTGILLTVYGFDAKIIAFAVITLTALILWALELLPDAMVATALPVIYIVAGVGTPQKILEPWTSAIGWLVLGGLIIGAFMMKTGLAKRLALRCIYMMGGSFNRLLWGILLAGLIMAPFIPSVLGRSAVLAVICIGICEALALEKGSREGAAILLAGFVAVAGPKLAFLTGGADLAMAMKLASRAMNQPVPWIEYAMHNFVPAVLYSAMSILCVIVILRPKSSGDIRSIVHKQMRELGPMTTPERKAMALLGVLLAFLVTDRFHGIDVGWIMLLLPCVAFLPGVNLLNEADFKKLNYPPILFVVGCMTIGSAAMACGADKLLGKALLPLLNGSEMYTVIAALGIGALIGLVLTPMAAYATLTIPIVEIAQHLQVPPLLVFYSYSYGLDQYLFPYEYAVLLYFYATGYPRMGHLIKVLGARMIASVPFVALIAYPYWKLVLGHHN